MVGDFPEAQNVGKRLQQYLMLCPARNFPGKMDNPFATNHMQFVQIEPAVIFQPFTNCLVQFSVIQKIEIGRNRRCRR